MDKTLGSSNTQWCKWNPENMRTTACNPSKEVWGGVERGGASTFVSLTSVTFEKNKVGEGHW